MRPPLFCFCGQWPLLVQLRSADCDGAWGVLEALQWMIPLIRTKWKNTRIIMRADSGFCRDPILTWIESQENLFYVVGLARNSRLEEEIDTELIVMSVLCRLFKRPQRIFKDFRWQTRGSWSCERRVVAKAGPCRAKPIPGSSSPICPKTSGRTRAFTRIFTVPGAIWRTGSRSISSSCSRYEPAVTT